MKKLLVFLFLFGFQIHFGQNKTTQYYFIRHAEKADSTKNPDLSKKGEVLQGKSLETIRNMVASNLGITVLPKSATSDRYQNHLIKVIPFIKPVPSRTIAIAYRKSFVRMNAVEKISEAIRLIKTDTIEMI